MPHLPDTHHDHDPALIAAFAAGAELSHARELVASCTSCAGLRDDLVAIAAAVGTLPAPRRTRDFRLTAEQAAALRPTGWRRLLGAFAGPRFKLAAPLGTTMATLGVAGLLLAAMPGAVLTGPAAGTPTQESQYGSGGGDLLTGNGAQPEASDRANAASGSPAPVASAGPSASGAPASAAPPAQGGGQAPAPTVLRQTIDAQASADPATDPRTAPVDSTFPAFSRSGSWQLLAVGSSALFVLGAMLVVVRLLARRMRPA